MRRAWASSSTASSTACGLTSLRHLSSAVTVLRTVGGSQNPRLVSNPPQPVKDFAAISMVGVTPLMLVVNAEKVPARTLPEFVAYLETLDFSRPLTLRPERYKDRVYAIHVIPYAGSRRLMQIKDITQADRLDQTRRDFVANVSHELKTPLTALREGVALLQDKVAGPLEGTQQEVVDILQHNVLTLQRQIESLLRLNAASFEARRLRYRPVQLKKLLADALQGRELQIQARRLVIRPKAPAVTRALDGDKLLVVLDNLLSNAIDFSPEGGVIRLEAEVGDDRVRITCNDQGPGIAPEDAERIFEPFVQGARAAPVERQGSGVGLSIVRELLAAMGGSVVVDRTQAGNGDPASGAPGACFRIEVPCE